MLRSIHFGVPPVTVQNKLERGYKSIFDIEKSQIRFKRPLESTSNVDGEIEVDETDDKEVTYEKQSSQRENLSEDHQDRKKNEEIFLAAIEVIKQSGRDQDFLTVLESLASGALDPQNIALQLFLDIGAFLTVETVNQVRYSNLTLNFWTLVKKLFHGKATSFFRGKT
jgi:hypothetical protein